LSLHKAGPPNGKISNMTKARARERAKARKGKKRQAASEASDQQPPPKMDANTKNFAAASRGSARSK
jgi:hypothetical protein